MFTSDVCADKLRAVLEVQYKRWWSIDIDDFESMWHFLQYAGRYVRRPPIAQHRFVEINNREFEFWTKDRKQKLRVKT